MNPQSLSRKKTSIKQKIILIIFGLFLCVVLLEIGLRMGGFIFLSLQEHRNRISIRQKGAYRIMCLGESTTAGQWPQPLEEILNQQDIGIKFSVIDKGISGIDLMNILLQLEENLNKYNPDMVIVMVGINDALYTIPGDIHSSKRTVLFFKNFRVYKLTKLLWLHIVNKAREIGIYTEEGKEEAVTLATGDSVRSDSFKEHEKMSKKSTEINHQESEVYAELARRFMDKKKYTEAEEMCKRAIEIDPENDRAYVELGICYEFLDDRGNLGERIVAMYNKALQINPQNDRPYVHLGLYYEHRQEYEKTAELYKKAIEINPENARAYFGLALCYKRLGEYDRAEEIFKKAIETNSENECAYEGLAFLYEEVGKYNLAKECRRKLSKIRSMKCNPATRQRFQRLQEIVTQRRTKLVCVQYPLRSVEELKNMFETKEGIIFVDNERVFKEALKTAEYEEYFVDNFAGAFGHCTERGNWLLAKNIADVILKECLNRWTK